MSNIELFLWLLCVTSTLLHWWVGKVYISQPRFNHPRIFWNPIMANTLTIAPQLGFLLTVIGGFILTGNGWWYLGVVIFCGIVFSSMPEKYRN